MASLIIKMVKFTLSYFPFSVVPTCVPICHLRLINEKDLTTPSQSQRGKYLERPTCPMCQLNIKEAMPTCLTWLLNKELLPPHVNVKSISIGLTCPTWLLSIELPPSLVNFTWSYLPYVAPKYRTPATHCKSSKYFSRVHLPYVAPIYRTLTTPCKCSNHFSRANFSYVAPKRKTLTTPDFNAKVNVNVEKHFSRAHLPYVAPTQYRQSSDYAAVVLGTSLLFTGNHSHLYSHLHLHLCLVPVPVPV